MVTNHTPNYSLNQWEADDQVKRTDFNEDNRKIDAALTAVNAQMAQKASTSALNSLKTSVNSLAGTVSGQGDSLALKGNCQIEITSYVGDGEDIRTHTFPRKPVMVFISGDVEMAFCYGATYALNYPYAAKVTWSGNSATLESVSAVAVKGSTAIANYPGLTYYIIALYNQST